METIFIKGTDISPEVIFNPAEKIYSISGWSRPESPSKFFAPVIKWIEDYGKQYLHNATIEFKIEYFNTPSARVLRDIMTLLQTLNKDGVSIAVNWYYEDESSKEEFEYEFAQGLSLPIKFIQKV